MKVKSSPRERKRQVLHDTHKHIHVWTLVYIVAHTCIHLYKKQRALSLCVNIFVCFLRQKDDKEFCSESHTVNQFFTFHHFWLIVRVFLFFFFFLFFPCCVSVWWIVKWGAVILFLVLEKQCKGGIFWFFGAKLPSFLILGRKVWIFGLILNSKWVKITGNLNNFGGAGDFFVFNGWLEGNFLFGSGQIEENEEFWVQFGQVVLNYVVIQHPFLSIRGLKLSRKFDFFGTWILRCFCWESTMYL